MLVVEIRRFFAEIAGVATGSNAFFPPLSPLQSRLSANTEHRTDCGPVSVQSSASNEHFQVSVNCSSWKPLWDVAKNSSL